MKFRYKLQKIVEVLTNRRCETCKYNTGLFCEHPDSTKQKKCRNGIFPVGYERRVQEDGTDHARND